MVRYRVIILGMILFMVHHASFSQISDKRFHHLTIRDGLSQSRVQAIHQDSDGYLWFGTADGLNRYNGYEFTVFRANADDPGSISDNSIEVIYEDSNGTLWIGTHNGGLMEYQPESDRFRIYTGIYEEWGWATLSSNMVQSLLEDSRGNFWVGTGYGLNVMNRSSGTFRRLTPENDEEPSPSDTEIKVLYESSDGVLWLGTSNGLEFYDYETHEFHQFSGFNDDDSPLIFGAIQSIHEDHYGILWIGSEGNGLFAIDRSNEVVTQYRHDPENPVSVSGNTIFSILEDSSGELWIGTGNNGLNIYDRASDTFRRYRENRENPFSISNNGITEIYESREGIIWIGTNDSGLNYFELGEYVMQIFQNEPFNPNSVSHNVVQSIKEIGQNEIWIGTDGGGLNIFEPVSASFINRERNPEGIQLPVSDVILDIHKKDGKIYLGTYGNGVEVYDLESGSITNLIEETGEPGILGSPYVFNIFESRDGILWFSKNGGGVTEYDPDSGEFNRYVINPNDFFDPVALRNNDPRVVFEDYQGKIWIGTYGGYLHKLDRESGVIDVYDINEGSQYYAGVVQTMYEDSEHRLWLGTAGGGLKQFDRENQRLVNIADRSNYLPSNVIHHNQEDTQGNIWMSSNNGITQLNLETNEYITYNADQGLLNSEFNPRSGSMMSDGTLYFGGVSGFVRFHPDSIGADSTMLPIVLTDLLLFNEPVIPGEESPLTNTLNYTDHITLPHSSTMITIGYTALNYSSRKSNQYAYRLLGFEENWNIVGDQRRAIYTNLSPGAYEFQVRSSNNSGIWSNEYKSLTITITPPFWQTAWFMLLSFVLVTGVISMTIWYRFRSMKLEKITLERVILDRTKELRISNETKDKLFKIIAHDLRNYAGNILGLSDLIKESSKEENIGELKEYSNLLKITAVQFDDFLKNLLEWARYQSDQINYQPKMVNLHNLIAHVTKQAEPNARNKKIDLVLDIEEDIEVYADPNLFSIVIFNLLSNAMKFSQAGSEIVISVKSLNDQEAEVSVRDHGIGMTEESVEKLLTGSERFSKPGTSGEKGTGIGFDLCRDFISKNGGKLAIDSEPDKGTTVRFTMPKNGRKYGN